MPAQGPDLSDRPAALKEVFHSIDEDGSGNIEMGEMLSLAKGLAPSMSVEEAKATFEFLDTDGDATVSEAEFLDAMVMLTANLSDAQFEAGIKDLLARSKKSVKADYYFHCAGNRSYLDAEVLPLVRRGLEELMVAVEEERLRVAAGTDWDQGYLPHEWKPIRPLRWLGEWLKKNSMTGKEQAAAEAAAAEEARPKAFHELSREQKLASAFYAVDVDGSGSLDMDEMLAICRKMNPGKGVEEARSQISWMDQDGDGQVDKDEFIKAMLELMEHVEESAFDAGINRIITAVKFAYAAREEKLKMVFDHIDVDASGGLDLQELTVLAKALVPGGDESKVQKTLAWLDQDGDRNITFDEFKEPMLKITEKLDDDTFDEAIHKLLQAKGEAAEPDPADDLPNKFGSYVGNMPTHATAKQIGIKKLNAQVKAKKKIAMIDCRAAEERNVSTIRNAIVVDIGEFKSVEENGVATALEKADLSRAAEAELVVVYSAAGLEAGVAAPLIEEKLGVPANNLCGGIIAWYNAGGEVVDAEGNSVEKVHPGIKRCIGFVRPRKNEFKFGKK